MQKKKEGKSEKAKGNWLKKYLINQSTERLLKTWIDEIIFIEKKLQREKEEIKNEIFLLFFCFSFLFSVFIFIFFQLKCLSSKRVNLAPWYEKLGRWQQALESYKAHEENPGHESVLGKGKKRKKKEWRKERRNFVFSSLCRFFFFLPLFLRSSKAHEENLRPKGDWPLLSPRAKGSDSRRTFGVGTSNQNCFFVVSFPFFLIFFADRSRVKG